jgi:hypothetical protein
MTVELSLSLAKFDELQRIGALMTVELSLSLAKFDELWAATEGRGKQCTIKKADLLALLMDHSRVLGAIDGSISEPEYKNHRKVRAS